MRNVTNLLMNAWMQLLDGNVGVPVYRVDAPPEEQGHYVLLRVESETENQNNQNFVTNPVIITEVVTRFKSRINDSKAADIDDLIAALIAPRPGIHNLVVPEGIQITDVRRLNATYIGEDDGTFRYHILATRNLHRVVQLTS